MPNLKLAYYGNPILRKKATHIPLFDLKLEQTIAEMIEIMYANQGGGLAAPQVSLSSRLFIIDMYLFQEKEAAEPLPDKDPSRVLTFVDPKIKIEGNEHWQAHEGCLSIPRLKGLVERPMAVSVEAFDIKGNLFKKSYSGWQARAILHENDHLNGTLYIDRMDKRDRKKIEEDLRKIERQFNRS